MKILSLSSTNYIFIFITILLQLIKINSIPIKVASVFRSDEAIYHKYSAILAASEPFRLQFQSDIESCFNPLQYIWYKFSSILSTYDIDKLRTNHPSIDSICSTYETRIDDVIK